MSQAGKVVVAKVVVAVVAVVVVFVAVMPFAPMVSAALPALFEPLSLGDRGSIFVAVAGAFGLAFVLAVPRER